MPKVYSRTKKSDLEFYIRSFPEDILPSVKTMAEAVGLSPQSVRAALLEWQANGRVVVKADNVYLKQSYCPDCTIDLPGYEFGDYKLKSYSVFPTKFEGILIYAKCPACKVRYVSRNRSDFQEAA